MSEALYRKWRPQKWDKVVGQDHIVQTLKNAIRGNRVGHAYLLSGPRGTGKTTTARLLAKAVNCLDDDLGVRPCNQCQNCLSVNAGRFMDLIEIDAASNTSVDDVRDLREKIGFSPSQGRFKVYIIDEVHMLSTAAFNALLKTLEEPPPHAIFVLATTEVHKIPATVLSRCQRHEFRRIPVITIVELLKDLVKAEKLEIDEETLFMIARQSTGAMRDAISLLDQLTSTGDIITLEIAQQVLGTATNQTVINLVDLLTIKDTKGCLDQLHSALDSGTDPRQFARQMVDYLRGLMLIQLGNEKSMDVTDEVRLIMGNQTKKMSLINLTELVKLFNNAANESRLAWQPSLALELAIAQGVQLFEGQTNKIQQSESIETEDRRAPKKTKDKEDKLTINPQEKEINDVKKAELEKVFDQSNTVQTTRNLDSDDGDLVEESSDPTISINDVRESLTEVKTLIRNYRKNTEALLASARNFSLKKGVIIIGFQSPVLKERMEKGDHQDIIQRAFSHILGADVKVRAVVLNAKSNLPDHEDEFEPDSLVSAALDLGGKIVDKE
ncbi:MAG: DNA polymerase III subunit gamma/tau [Anaerolineaceae bacterium]|nr:DNA polymerase III subunit gamma/tau [Anaerolineaceae bacterium]